MDEPRQKNGGISGRPISRRNAFVFSTNFSTAHLNPKIQSKTIFLFDGVDAMSQEELRF